MGPSSPGPDYTLCSAPVCEALVLQEAAGRPEAQGSGLAPGERPRRACRLHLRTLLPQRALGQINSPLRVASPRWKGPPLALQ